MGSGGERRSARVRIEGRVQGVGYRAWVEGEATGLGLDGWVRNRRDGGVEAVFAGPAADVETMVARCRQGPRAAAVAMVKVLDGPADVAHGFHTLPTA